MSNAFPFARTKVLTPSVRAGFDFCGKGARTREEGCEARRRQPAKYFARTKVLTPERVFFYFCGNVMGIIYDSVCMGGRRDFRHRGCRLLCNFWCIV